jgi:sugar lactone lactonase YvrE
VPGVYVFTPKGTLLGWIDFAGNVGNVAWGEDGSTLFIAANSAVYRVRLTTRGWVGRANEAKTPAIGRGLETSSRMDAWRYGVYSSLSLGMGG